MRPVLVALLLLPAVSNPALASGIESAGTGVAIALPLVAGGIGTLLVVAVWAKLFPPLRSVDRFTDVAVP